MLCIDKRTGQIAYQSDQLPPIAVANFELTGDPARQIVRAQQSTGKRAPDRIERDGGENAKRGLMRALDEEIERLRDRSPS